jgi:hypothetical protein
VAAPARGGEEEGLRGEGDESRDRGDRGGLGFIRHDGAKPRSRSGDLYTT